MCYLIAIWVELICMNWLSFGYFHNRNNDAKGKHNHICVLGTLIYWCLWSIIQLLIGNQTLMSKNVRQCHKISCNWTLNGTHHTCNPLVKILGKELSDTPKYSDRPQIGKLDKLETFVGVIKIRFGCWRLWTTALNVWVISDVCEKP